MDLGKWWQKVTGLPLPLGGNAIRRSLGPELMTSVGNALRESIQYALDHREEALAYAMQFARDLRAPNSPTSLSAWPSTSATLTMGPREGEAVRLQTGAIRRELFRKHQAVQRRPVSPSMKP